MADKPRRPDKIQMDEVLGSSETEFPEELEEIEVLDPGAGGSEHAGGSPSAPSEGAGVRSQDAGELHAAREEIEKYRDLYLRSRADLENFRKRIERERDLERTQAGAALVGELLPVLDNLERALESEPAEIPFRDGVALIQKQLRETLLRAGLEPIEAVGEAFNPLYHEAVATEPTERWPAGTVLEEAQKGYTFRGRVLRPALVKVAEPPGTVAGRHGARTHGGGGGPGGAS